MPTSTTELGQLPPTRSTLYGAAKYRRHDDLLDVPVAGGERDSWSVDAVLDLLPTLPTWPRQAHRWYRDRLHDGARAILEWLSHQPCAGWQDRWLRSGADEGLAWLDQLVATTDASDPQARVASLRIGLKSLMLCRIVMPSHEFLDAYHSQSLLRHAREVFRPDLFAGLEEHAHELDVGERRLALALKAITRIVLHTGRDLDQLTAEDVLALRACTIRLRGKTDPGVSLAWTLLRHVTDLGPHLTLREAVRVGQRPTAELVDSYRIQSRSVREVLIRYLDERRATLDYSSLRVLIGKLVGRFWADVEHHHPGIDSLELSDEVAEAWKQRLRTVAAADGSTRPRADYYEILTIVRGFYKDLHEWSHEDPYWATWAVRTPIHRRDTAGSVKARKKTIATMHQRTRERLPHLDALVATAERHKNEQAALLAATDAAQIGETFTHADRRYRRIVPHVYTDSSNRNRTPPSRVLDLDTGATTDVGRNEHNAFMAWAVIEVLRHTGVRVEELLEITHLGLVSYTLPDTGETVPMLQIVPSKVNEERLLLVSPELASVLALIITRLRSQNRGAIPLTARYDHHERTTGPPLPHLLQHRVGWSWEVPGVNMIQKWLSSILTLTGITDAAGEPLRCTPHDFRRMFASEAVGIGLPVHIIARLLGHTNINTTQAYMAIFDEQLVRAYRAFLDQRRAQRPEPEYREPTDEEWREFQQHFQRRKLALGECGRPYGTPCKHEHACIRCPSLRLTPSVRPRLVEIIANLRDRVQEAQLNGWLGEVAGLQASLNEAARKLTSLDRAQTRGPAGPVDLGVPTIADSPA
ncbi:site-specific integrase [Amycolatopsis sp. CA-128772]|uniref:site-specific integrase n=1 Tax=Amycolatopsis sp. CA-128772 TaxID=2073159 RepID=UPI000CCFDBC7|nr:site-specific integrase [Amycolatopsis sp. CA-128772]